MHRSSPSRGGEKRKRIKSKRTLENVSRATGASAAATPAKGGGYAEPTSVPSFRIGILGDPVHPVTWTDDGLEKLKARGFNEIQLNIAWGSHPTGDPIVLADVVTVPGENELEGTPERRAELKRRVTMAERHGLRMLFHTGSPYMDRNPATGDVSRTPYHIDDVTFDSWYDILNPKVRDHEFALLREFRRQFPEVEDILVYTYDVESWQTPEFQFTKYSYGIPLADRLPAYLSGLNAIWTDGRETRSRMWWEPWELSAGQIYAVLPKLPRTGFGLIMHSNIGEAQLAMPVDVWFRNTARICQGLGIPVLAHAFFASASEETEPLSLPAPRLVDEQYLAFMAVPGVAGIKEYYGINMPLPDFDVDILQARLRNPSHSTDQLLDEITHRFGEVQPDVRAYLDLLAEARQVYPWDASWRAREVGRASTDHGWSGATILGPQFSAAFSGTPSWRSTRRARFMQMDNSQPHFWMLEDVQLRCKLAADLTDKAHALGLRLLEKFSDADDRAHFSQIQNDLDVFGRVSRSYALHLRETNVAQMLRQDLEAGRPMVPALVKELSELLDLDVTNQKGKGRVVEMRRLWLEDSGAFLRRYLIPEREVQARVPREGEKGPFTLTTR